MISQQDKRVCATLCVGLSLWLTPAGAQQRPVVADNAFIEAARAGQLAVLEAAYANDMPNRIGVNGQSALHVAAQWGRLAVVKKLLDWGSKPDKRARDKNTPLVYAILHGHGAVAVALLDAGADPDLYGADYELPLLLAARLGDVQSVRALIAAKADMHATDQTGRTALDWARQMNHRQVMDVLQNGAKKANVAE